MAMVCTALCVLLVGCNSKTTAKDVSPETVVQKNSDEPSKTEPSKTEPSKTEPSKTEPIKAEAAEAATIKIAMLELGKEPRKELRYDFSDIKKQTVEMSMKMAMSLEMGPISRPRMQMPTMTMFLDLVPSEATDDELRYTFELTKVDVDDKDAEPIVVSSMKTALEEMLGLSGWALVSPRGVVKNAKINVPEKVDAQAKDMMDQMNQQIRQITSPLPEEAVGVGARWEVIMPVKTDKMELSQTAIFTLKEFKVDGVVLAVEITQNAPEQDLSVPMGKAHLISLTSIGSGTTEVKFKQLVPIAEMKLKTEMKASISSLGQEQMMNTTIEMEIKSNEKL